ncbi:hypothetical protein EV182_003954 [Spiromyces aspiralis]|uniref:Uncharacterized protein n=1 Tax=Spiromyces aspiralis TaxID=68401 RepID=A0ACC1HVU9_9FUNG|nr:hypothetical protein EV182_003954 [Spiromyces aspiralis]
MEAPIPPKTEEYVLGKDGSTKRVSVFTSHLPESHVVPTGEYKNIQLVVDIGGRLSFVPLILIEYDGRELLCVINPPGKEDFTGTLKSVFELLEEFDRACNVEYSSGVNYSDCTAESALLEGLKTHSFEEVPKSTADKVGSSNPEDPSDPTINDGTTSNARTRPTRAPYPESDSGMPLPPVKYWNRYCDDKSNDESNDESNDDLDDIIDYYWCSDSDGC